MNTIVITPELIDNITRAAKTSEFAKQKLESATKSFLKVKDQLNLEK